MVLLFIALSRRGYRPQAQSLHLGARFDDFSLKQNIFYVIVLTKLRVIGLSLYSCVVSESAPKLQRKSVTAILLKNFSVYTLRFLHICI